MEGKSHPQIPYAVCTTLCSASHWWQCSFCYAVIISGQIALYGSSVKKKKKKKKNPKDLQSQAFTVWLVWPLPARCSVLLMQWYKRLRLDI